MLSSKTFFSFAFVLASSLTGACSTSSEEDVAQTDDELRALKPSEIVGTIAYGDTVGPLAYSEVPLYRALKFTAKKGDTVDAWVRSSDGDARAWLVSGTFTTLASNDNASSTDTNAHIVHALGKAGTYYIVWREKNKEDAAFTVSLNASGGGTTGSAFKATAGAYTLHGACETIGGGVAPKAETAVVTVYTQPDGTQPSLRIESISGDGIYRPLPIDTNTLPVDGGLVAQWSFSEVGGLVSKSGSVTLRKTSSSATYALDLVGTYYLSGLSTRKCAFDFSEPFSSAASKPEVLPDGMMTAVGSCQGTETYPHACVPGTPGRDSNGCCTTVSPYGGAADIQIQVSTAADGTRKLHVIDAPSFTPAVANFHVDETGAGTMTFDANPALYASFVQGAFVITTSAESAPYTSFCGTTTTSVRCRFVVP